jgi:hypothetical protein
MSPSYDSNVGKSADQVTIQDATKSQERLGTDGVTSYCRSEMIDKIEVMFDAKALLDKIRIENYITRANPCAIWKVSCRCSQV